MKKFMLFALHSCAAWASYNFGPDKAESWLTPNIPTLYDLTASQFQSAPISSYYAGSFLTTTNGNQYFVVSHLLLLTQQPQSNIRHSILDITNPSTIYLTTSSFVPTPPQPPPGKATTSGPWSYSLPNYTFSSPSSDSVSRMHTRASADKYSFDLSFAATSSALHNLGAGTFAFSSGNNSQWSLPACRTYGTLTIGEEEELTVDPARSLTWYDRQWGYVSAPPAFTWMGLRFPDGISLSVWAIDYHHSDDEDAQQWRFATVQTPQGNMILDVAVRPDEGSVWTSPATGKAYAGRWGLEFQNGDVVNVTAVRPDQELGTGISAFARVEGAFMGAEGGFGVVDVLG
ncbi:Terpene cyclase asqC [Lasiodiplodia hormozganensis]|uniref:Terpene cyclase asqC n=1 Tax=Lasiodiplodia hormozganensis TaxID=869390 RepID=A0AA39Y7S0_9PEZI|nr:Terpene cyclase asqC [Lasiodiplodia hormozganensis]